MNNNKELIEFLERTLLELKKQQQRTADQIEFEQYVADKLKQIADDVAAIRKSIA